MGAQERDMRRGEGWVGADKGEQTSNAAAVNKQLPTKRSRAAAAQRLLLSAANCRPARSCLGLNYVIRTMLQFHILYQALYLCFFHSCIWQILSGPRLCDRACKEGCGYNTGTSGCVHCTALPGGGCGGGGGAWGQQQMEPPSGPL